MVKYCRRLYKMMLGIRRSIRNKVLSVLLSILVMMLCLAPSMGIGGFAVDEAYGASSTKADGTYAGTFPSLPNSIAAKAIEFAWPYGTDSSEYKYSSGAPVDAFEKGIQTAYGSRSNWRQQPAKDGASCDVFVGTVVRNSYDKNYPRGLAQQGPYLAKSSIFTEVNTRDTSKMKDGDIITYGYKTAAKSGGHTCIIVTINGKVYLAHANYNKTYGFIAKAPNFNNSFYKNFHVYRATGTCRGALAKGQYSANVKYLQQFLNWAGFNCGTPDGAFGSATEKAVKEFQKAAGLEADGKFGSKSLAAAKAFKKGSASSENASPLKDTGKISVTAVKKGFTGKWPTGTVSKKKGSRTNIKRWQAFLKWNGYQITTGGTFGSKTIKYTKAFQKKYGLTADGVVGPKTLKKAKTIKK